MESARSIIAPLAIPRPCGGHLRGPGPHSQGENDQFMEQGAVPLFNNQTLTASHLRFHQIADQSAPEWCNSPGENCEICSAFVVARAGMGWRRGGREGGRGGREGDLLSLTAEIDRV